MENVDLINADEKLDLINKYLAFILNENMVLKFCYVSKIKKFCLALSYETENDCEKLYYGSSSSLINEIFFETPGEAIDNFLHNNPKTFRDMSWSGIMMAVAVALG